MDLLIKDVLEMPALQEAKLIAGEKGQYNRVSDITVMEAHDIDSWLKPGQLVLTSLFSMQESTAEEYRLFIQTMKTYGASGLILKMGRFVDTIPESLRTECNQADLPLIVIAEAIPYRAITMEVMQKIINQKAAMLDLYQQIHHNFKDLAMHNPSPKDILLTLKAIIHRDVLLLDANLQVEATTETGAIGLKLDDLREIYQETYMHYPYYRTLVDDKSLHSLLLGKIVSVDGKVQYLAVREREHFVEMTEYMAIENAASMFQFENIKASALSKAKQSHRNDLVDTILNGKYKNFEELNEDALTLELSLDKKYRVLTWRHVLIKVGDNKRSFDQHSQYLSLSTKIVETLKAVWPHFAYRIFSNRLTFIIEDNFTSTEAFRTMVEATLRPIYESYSRDALLFYVGISNQGDLADIHKLATQPLRVVQVFDMLPQQEGVILYEELGVYRILIELAKENDLVDYIPTKLNVLANHDPEYLETIRVFLDSNQNYKLTSEILFVHPKTVRYRIEKIKELSNLNFDDAEEMLQVMIGLRILNLLKNKIN